MIGHSNVMGVLQMNMSRETQSVYDWSQPNAGSTRRQKLHVDPAKGWTRGGRPLLGDASCFLSSERISELALGRPPHTRELAFG